MIKFETNQAYTYGYACNASSCVGIEVIKRTEKEKADLMTEVMEKWVKEQKEQSLEIPF